MGEKSLKSHVGNWTLANQLTFLRLVAIPFFIIAVLSAHFGVAFWIFVAAGVTDLLDGLIARVFRQGTALGAFLDPLADKLLLTAAFLLLTEYPHMFREIPMVVRVPIWLSVLTISRDVFIVVVALTLYLAYRKTRFRPTLWGKATTLAEIITIAAVLLANHLGRSHAAIRWVMLATLLLTVGSGLDYLWRTIRQVRVEEKPVGTSSE
jgi:cardiolipin synthase